MYMVFHRRRLLWGLLAALLCLLLPFLGGLAAKELAQSSEAAEMLAHIWLG